MPDLLTQISDYARQLDEETPHLQELLPPMTSPDTVSSAPTWWRNAFAAMAAAVAVVVVVALAVYIGRSQPADVVDEVDPPSTTVIETDLVEQSFPPTFEWKRVQLPGSPDAGARAVIPFGDGFVAVGSSPGGAIVWTSSDGSTWTEAFVHGGDSEMVDIIEGGPGLIAVGIHFGDAAVWTSSDAQTWTKAPGQPVETGGGWLNALAAGPEGIVAVGAEQVFTTEDGLSWVASPQNLPTEPPFFGWMADVVAGGPGFVAVGQGGQAAMTDGETTSPSIWTSEDGITWSGTSIGPRVGSWTMFNMAAVTTGGPGLVAVGHGLPPDAIPAESPLDNEQVAWVWISEDGTMWTRAPHNEATFDGMAMTDVVLMGDTLIAVGGRVPLSPDPNIAVVWASADGVSWQRLPHVEAFNWGPMQSVVPHMGGLVAVGGNSVWFGTPRQGGRAGSGQFGDALLPDLALTPVEWMIQGTDQGLPRLHMIAKFGPLTGGPAGAPLEGTQVSGRLVWEETAIELPGLSVRDLVFEAVNSGTEAWFVRVGDILELWDAFGLWDEGDQALAETLDEYGLPTSACIEVTLESDSQSYAHCGPLLDEAMELDLGEITVTPVEWEISLNEMGTGVHAIGMVVHVGPLPDELAMYPDETVGASGTLRWGDTVVELCGMGLRDVGDVFVQVGDIFGTSEGCSDNPTAMQDAFDALGLPDEACVIVTTGEGAEPLTHCAALPTSTQPQP